MRQPVHARRAFRGFVQIGLAILGYGALFARPQTGALGALGALLYAVAGWGAYPLLALLLAWGVALVAVGLTRRAPLSRLQLASAAAETLALLLAVRVFVGGNTGGWLAGVLARPVTGLPSLVAHALPIILVLVLLLPLARITPRAAYRAVARLRDRSHASHDAARVSSDGSPTTTPATTSPSGPPAARGPQPAQPTLSILRYVESAPPTPRMAYPRANQAPSPSGEGGGRGPAPPRALLAAPAATPATIPTDPTATPTRIVASLPTPPNGFPGGQGWPTAGRADVPWHLPPLDLFDAPATLAQIDQHDLLVLAARLDAALRRAGVDAWVPREDLLVGPALLTFVLTPPPHLRREQAGKWLASVLQRREAILAALDIAEARMTFPPPGAAASGMPSAARVWVQLPHATPRSISLHEVATAPTLTSSASAGSPSLLPLGRTTLGEARGLDLAHCAHLVIGGGARTGKSSLVQTVLAGMLARATPRELALALADPTRHALGEFEGLPHLLAPVATTPSAVIALLDTALDEAARRERLLAARGASSFAAYRALCQGSADQPPLPSIVLALDAIDTWDAPTRRALSSRVPRLAGVGRLTGIALVLAGQVPAATPFFQALEGMLAARVAFATESASDARGVLGIGGAEELTRAGDLLFLPNGSGTVEHIHAARVSDEELHRLTRFWQRQAALAIGEDATTIPGLYSAPEDATVLLNDARGQRSTPVTPHDDNRDHRDNYDEYDDHDGEGHDSPLALPPLPGRQPRAFLSRSEGDSAAHVAANARGGVPLAMFERMMRALVTRDAENTEDTEDTEDPDVTETFGGRRHWSARGNRREGTDEED